MWALQGLQAHLLQKPLSATQCPEETSQLLPAQLLPPWHIPQPVQLGFPSGGGEAIWVSFSCMQECPWFTGKFQQPRWVEPWGNGHATAGSSHCPSLGPFPLHLALGVGGVVCTRALPFSPRRPRMMVRFSFLLTSPALLLHARQLGQCLLGVLRPAGSAKCSGEGVHLQMLLGLYGMWSHVASVLSSGSCFPPPGRKEKPFLMSCCYTQLLPLGKKTELSGVGGRQTFHYIHLYYLNFVPCASITSFSEKLFIFRN